MKLDDQNGKKKKKKTAKNITMHVSSLMNFFHQRHNKKERMQKKIDGREAGDSRWQKKA